MSGFRDDISRDVQTTVNAVMLNVSVLFSDVSVSVVSSDESQSELIADETLR